VRAESEWKKRNERRERPVVESFNPPPLVLSARTAEIPSPLWPRSKIVGKPENPGKPYGQGRAMESRFQAIFVNCRPADGTNLGRVKADLRRSATPANAAYPPNDPLKFAEDCEDCASARTVARWSISGPPLELSAVAEAV